MPHVLCLKLKMGRESSLASDLYKMHENIFKTMVVNWGMSFDDIKMLVSLRNWYSRYIARCLPKRRAW